MEQVVLKDYNSQWPEQFEEEAQHLRQATGKAVVAVEHIGSTAIPGLSAKPIIDILLVVSTLSAGEESVPALEALGYEYRGENGIPGRLFFRKGLVQYRRTHHLHLVEMGHEQRSSLLSFRDYLRTHPDEAGRYDALKRELSVRFREDRSAYSDGKTAFINAMLAKAGTPRG